MKENERIEEALEKLWLCLEENSEPDLATVNYLDKELGVSLESLIQCDLVQKSEEKLQFTATGRQAAEQTIRRHRLSERLFYDVIDTGKADMEKAACQVEHVVKKGIEEKICRLLGHPETCPHDKPIPPGKCCLMAKETREKFVVPLTRLKKGEKAVIAYIKAGDSKKLQKLMAMGVLPGNAIFLDRVFPSFVFSVGYSQYAVDTCMAEEIFVRRGKEEATINNMEKTSWKSK
jgi:DtxR family Mn-dependent transcriptional regulator